MKIRDAPKTQKPLRGRLHYCWRRWKRSLLVINDTPHRIALGCAIGVFVTFQPIVGIQMIIGACLALILGGNPIASLPPAWITNPLTIVPIFFATYRIGAVFTGGSRTWEDIQAMIERIESDFAIGFFAGLDQLGSELTRSLFLPMVIGGAVVGIVAAPASYFLVRRAAQGYQHRRTERRLHWQGRRRPGRRRKKTERRQSA